MIENSNKSNLKDEKYYKIVQFFFLHNYAFFNFPKIRYTLLFFINCNYSMIILYEITFFRFLYQFKERYVEYSMFSV